MYLSIFFHSNSWHPNINIKTLCLESPTRSSPTSGGTSSSYWYTQDSPQFGLTPAGRGGKDQTAFFIDPTFAHRSPFQQIFEKESPILASLFKCHQSSWGSLTPCTTLSSQEIPAYNISSFIYLKR